MSAKSTVVFVLHEMSPELRPALLQECRRVLKPDGRIMLIDYHPGPYPLLMGQLWHLVITLMEISAGSEHYGNYRKFIAAGGVQKRYVSDHGVTAIYLVGAG